MSGMGPITNTRSLKSALRETIGNLERAKQRPMVVKLLARCREYRHLVEEWDTVSPPPDEQFETIGQIMQLLGAAMQAAKQAAREEPSLEFHTIEPLGESFHELDVDEDVDDVHSHQVLELDLAPASTHSEVVELYKRPWRKTKEGIRFKTLNETSKGRRHALVRIEDDAVLPGQRHDEEECIYVLDGCIQHGDKTVSAGACLRIGAGSKSSTIKAVGEATLLLIDSRRRAIKF